MLKWPEDYVEKVLKDVEFNRKKRRIVKAGLIERYSRKTCNPEELHANPDDEFSYPEIGPNFEIINDYIKYLDNAIALELPIYNEPLIVEKIEDDGYLLLNGHHRWFAALRMHVKKVRIKIVNLVHEADLNRMLEKTSNTKRVAFDLDEVLLSADKNNQEPLTDKILEKRIDERLRKGAVEVIQLFQSKGYDVWVYTSSYSSEEYINHFFSMYGLEITGVINGINEKRMSNRKTFDKIKSIMEKKYTKGAHVDNDTVVFVDPSNKCYEQYNIFEDRKEWKDGVINILLHN